MLVTVQVLQTLAKEVQEEGADGSDQAGQGDVATISDLMGKGAVAYLAMRALLALGRGAEAQMELLTMASAPDTPLDLCMAAVKVCQGGTGQHMCYRHLTVKSKSTISMRPADLHICRSCWRLKKRSWPWCRH